MSTQTSNIYRNHVSQLSLEEHQWGGRLYWFGDGLGDPWGLFDATDCPCLEKRLDLWDQMNIYHVGLEFWYSQEYGTGQGQLEGTTEVVEQNPVWRQGSACTRTGYA
jgi:hypothetical protein